MLSNLHFTFKSISHVVEHALLHDPKVPNMNKKFFFLIGYKKETFNQREGFLPLFSYVMWNVDTHFKALEKF